MKRTICMVLMLLGASASGAERPVESAEAIASALSQAKPGDVIVMKDGKWKDQVVRFEGKGDPEKPITLRAQTAGKVVLSGKSSIEMQGDNLVLDGVFLDRSTGDGDGIVVHGDHNRITECAVVAGGY